MDFMSVSFASILGMIAMGGSLEQAKPQAQEAKVSTYELPAITGQWLLALDKAKPGCQERYNFGRNQQFFGASGAEFTYGKYLFSPTSDGLPALAIQTQYDNNAIDCSGNQVDQAGEIMVTYIKQTGDTIQWCADSAGKKCEMTLRRVLP